MRARRSLIGTIIVATVGLLVYGVGPAWAQLNELATFGTPGAGAGELSSPQGVAVNQSLGTPSSGDVYVADTTNARVEQFDASGNFIRTWGWGVQDGASSFETCTSACETGIAGSGVGQLSSPTNVAVDSSNGPSRGDIYVADSGNDVIDKFGPLGAFLSAITGPSASAGFSYVTGVAVDGSGDIWVLDAGANIVYEFDDTGALISQFADGYDTTLAIAADSDGNVYLTAGDGDTQRWTAPARAAGPNNGVPVDGGSGTGLAVDDATGRVYVDEGTSINEYDGAGDALGNFGSGTLAGGAQMAFDPAVKLAGAGGPGALYVADQTSNEIDIFVPPLPTAPTVLPGSEAVANIGANSATLNATVSPNGADTRYYFEYVANARYDQTAYDPYTAGAMRPLPPGTDIGSSFAAEFAGADLSGLTAATTYHFRVLATNAGGTSYGADQTFTTAANPLSAVRPIVRRGRLVLGVRGSVTNRVADVSASCRGAKGTTCAGRVVVSARERVSAIVHARRRWVVKTVAIGGARFKLVGGQMTVLRVKLSHGGARGLPAGGNHVVVTVVVTQAGRGKVTRRVTLERERER